MAFDTVATKNKVNIHEDLHSKTIMKIIIMVKITRYPL